MMNHRRNTTDAIWLRLENYHAVPLNPRLGEHTLELERAIQRGIPAQPDVHRHNFYELELETGWAYIHVRDNGKIVYLVAHCSSTSPLSPEVSEDERPVANLVGLYFRTPLEWQSPGR
jgi:hypothetical protein